MAKTTYRLEELEQQLSESRREFTAASATIHNLERQLAEVVSVPDERAAFETFMEKRFKDCIDRRLVRNGDGEYFALDMQVAWITWQGRAAMLQGAEPEATAYKFPNDFICMLTGRAKYLREKGEIKSPELLERAAAALQGGSVNTPPIPNGWKLVPIDPTKDMLRAGQSVVGFWLNTVHCYSKMLAAAPAAPQQEVNK